MKLFQLLTKLFFIAFSVGTLAFIINLQFSLGIWSDEYGRIWDNVPSNPFTPWLILFMAFIGVFLSVYDFFLFTKSIEKSKEK